MNKKFNVLLVQIWPHTDKYEKKFKTVAIDDGMQKFNNIYVEISKICKIK